MNIQQRLLLRVLPVLPAMSQLEHLIEVRDRLDDFTHSDAGYIYRRWKKNNIYIYDRQ